MAINRGVYAADGSFRVTVVDGTTRVGTYAPDGSLNVKVRSDETGYYDQSGAMLVTVRTVAGSSVYAADGSVYVSTTPYVHGSVHVTAVSGSLGASIAAPALTWNSTSADTTPDFLVDLPSGNTPSSLDAAAGDHLIIEYRLQSGGSWTQYLDRTLIAGDISTDTISATGVGAISSGDYYFRARIERSPLIGTNSSNTSVTIAATTSRRISSAGNVRISSTGNNRIFA